MQGEVRERERLAGSEVARRAGDEAGRGGSGELSRHRCPKAGAAEGERGEL